MKKFLVLISLLSGIAEAGGLVGNGGNSVVCRNAKGEVTSAEVLDFYEARVQRGIQIVQDSNSDYRQIAKSAFEKMAKKLPKRAKMYLNWAANFEKEAAFMADIELPDVKDSYHVFIPKVCKVEQVIIQKAPQFADDKRYLVNKEIWDKMNAMNKGGLMAHEIIYRHALEAGHTDSVATRYFNSYVFADKFSNMSFYALVRLLKEVNIGGLELNGKQVQVQWDRGFILRFQQGETVEFPYGVATCSKREGCGLFIDTYSDASGEQLLIKGFAVDINITLNGLVFESREVSYSTDDEIKRMTFTRPYFLKTNGVEMNATMVWYQNKALKIMAGNLVNEPSVLKTEKGSLTVKNFENFTKLGALVSFDSKGNVNDFVGSVLIKTVDGTAWGVSGNPYVLEKNESDIYSNGMVKRARFGPENVKLRFYSDKGQIISCLKSNADGFWVEFNEQGRATKYSPDCQIEN